MQLIIDLTYNTIKKDIFTLLSKLSPVQKPSNQPIFKIENHGKDDKKFNRKIVGVPITSNAANVTVLTPVRAFGKFKGMISITL